MTYLTATPGGVRLRMRAQPGARRTEIAGDYADALKVKIAAPPEHGRANVLLCKFLAELFGVPKSEVELTSGAASRSKNIDIRGLSLTAAQSAVQNAIRPK